MSSCRDGPRWASAKLQRRRLVWSGHVFGLLVRSFDDRWPAGVPRIGFQSSRCTRGAMTKRSAPIQVLTVLPCCLSLLTPLGPCGGYAAWALSASPDVRNAHTIRAVLSACATTPAPPCLLCVIIRASL